MERRHLKNTAAGATLCASLLAGSVALPSVAAAEIWTVARGPSSVEFAVDHLIFSEVAGRFSRFEGTVDCPSDDFSDATVEVAIDIGSVYTGHADRDRHLLAEDFFEAERFPEMRFASRSVERTGPATYRLVGALTIRGITRDIELEASYLGERNTAAGRRRDFRASGSINRSDFGITWNDTWVGRALVAEDVRITLRIALIATPS